MRPVGTYPPARRLCDDSGAILIHVAIAILAIMGLAAFAVDMGVMWLVRGQAQNAADAGALAGAVAWTYDEPNDVPAGNSPVIGAANSLGQTNNVFSAAATLGPVKLSPATPCPPSAIGGTAGTRCVTVEVFKDGTNSSTRLPTYFGHVLGATFQKVRATATAQAAPGNTSHCLKPWMIPDKWAEHSTPANQTFNLGVDTYAPPVPGPGTGYTRADIGVPITLSVGDPKNAIGPSFYYDMDLDNDPGGGIPDYRDRILNCANIDKGIDPLDPNRGQILTFPGNHGQATQQTVTDLINLDSSASWNGTTVVGSSFTKSPRIVLVALFSPQEFEQMRNNQGRFMLTIVNILPFFIQSVTGGNVTGIIVRDTAELSIGNPLPNSNASFAKVITLVR